MKKNERDAVESGVRLLRDSLALPEYNAQMNVRLAIDILAPLVGQQAGSDGIIREG